MAVWSRIITAIVNNRPLCGTAHKETARRGASAGTYSLGDSGVGWGGGTDMEQLRASYYELLYYSITVYIK